MESSQRENSNLVRMRSGRWGPWLTHEGAETLRGGTSLRDLAVFSPSSWWVQRAVHLSKPPAQAREKMFRAQAEIRSVAPKTQNQGQPRPWEDTACSKGCLGNRPSAPRGTAGGAGIPLPTLLCVPPPRDTAGPKTLQGRAGAGWEKPTSNSCTSPKMPSLSPALGL